MPDPAGLLLIQFLGWVSRQPRTYAEAMDAWRSSCPRLAVWDDALCDGLIQVECGGPLPHSRVLLTPRGQTLLDGTPGVSCTSARPPAPLHCPSLAPP